MSVGRNRKINPQITKQIKMNNQLPNLKAACGVFSTDSFYGPKIPLLVTNDSLLSLPNVAV